jgi:flagellar basal-body rod modification protein FlgD
MATTNDSSGTGGVSGIAGIAAAPTAARKTASSLNVTDFLKLMTTQLQNQDPLKPLDSTEFVSQLAQFGTVAGVQGMQTSLSGLASALQSSQILSGATMVGHQVLTAANQANYAGAGAISGTVVVPAGYPQVTLQVTDAAGQVVRHVALGTAAGEQSFQWDGRTDGGAQAAGGQYKLEVIAGGAGSNVSLQTFLVGRVGSVSLDAAGTGLTVNTRELGSIALGQIREII